MKVLIQNMLSIIERLNSKIDWSKSSDTLGNAETFRTEFLQPVVDSAQATMKHALTSEDLVLLTSILEEFSSATFAALRIMANGCNELGLDIDISATAQRLTETMTVYTKILQLRDAAMLEKAMAG